MASIISKRRAIHKNLTEQLRQNETLRFQVDQLQALANIGIATSMIAHEINNLLTPVANYADLALQYPEDTALTEKALKKVSSSCRRASGVMQSILAVANGETENREERVLRELIDDIFNCLCRDFAKDGITVELDMPADLKVNAVPVQVQQVMMNLILNAREAMLENGGTLTVTAAEIEDGIEIQVRDNGCGIAKEHLERIFEPFFTTKKGMNSETCGSGLGLCYCKKTVESAGGSLEVTSEPGNGTEFTIVLPS